MSTVFAIIGAYFGIIIISVIASVMLVIGYGIYHERAARKQREKTIRRMRSRA